MKSSDVFNLLPSAIFRYIDVTEEEIEAVPTAKYVSEYYDRKILGTLEEVTELAVKQVIEGSMLFEAG